MTPGPPQPQCRRRRRAARAGRPAGRRPGAREFAVDPQGASSARGYYVFHTSPGLVAEGRVAHRQRRQAPRDRAPFRRRRRDGRHYRRRVRRLAARPGRRRCVDNAVALPGAPAATLVHDRALDRPGSGRDRRRRPPGLHRRRGRPRFDEHPFPSRAALQDRRARPDHHRRRDPRPITRRAFDLTISDHQVKQVFRSRPGLLAPHRSALTLLIGGAAFALAGFAVAAVIFRRRRPRWPAR
jgi:hypothetical protein